MEKISAVIVEDEELARSLLRKYLEPFTEIQILAEFENGFDAVKGINELKPDVLFLDIQVPKINGFEILELLDYTPVIIFTTAYNEYAIKAFEISAVDYLLKPFTKERLCQAIEKAKGRLNLLNEEKQKVESLVKVDEELSGFIERVVIKDRQAINIVPVADVIWLEAQDDYVMIHTNNGRFMKQKTMSFFEKSLDPAEFIRVHRSFIVRINQISKLELYGKDTYLLFLKNGEKVNVSRSRYKDLKQVLNIG